ncbi:MAG: hypothetical protein K2M31_07795 [Muribaculaceae bacterium]|nr:hypothetical protein [Muribaculaceae bacterium]
MSTVNTVKFTPEQLAEAAAKFSGKLLQIPRLSLDAMMQYLTPRLGITGKEIVGTSAARAQLHPYRRDEIQEGTAEVQLRVLETHFGTCNYPFAPNDIIKTILGHIASQAKGDNLKSTISAQMVLADVAASIGEDLGYAVWQGKFNPDGKDTLSLFDGYDEITRKEIEAGNIHQEKGNYAVIKRINKENAVDVFKYIARRLHPILRRTECFMFVDPWLADMYNDCYAMTHQGLVYNDKYDQVAVEGTAGKLIIVPLAEKAGSQYIQISPKSNMLFGCDGMSDKESINIGKYSPDTLMFELRTFYGVQFESLDPRRLFVAYIEDIGADKNDFENMDGVDAD